MLQRLHALQKEMHEEFLQAEASKAEENQRNFSMFGSPNKMTSPNSAFTPVKGKNFKSPSKGDQSVSPTKISPSKMSPNKWEKSPVKSDLYCYTPEKLASVKETDHETKVNEFLNSPKTEILNSDITSVNKNSGIGENKPVISYSQAPGCSDVLSENVVKDDTKVQNSVDIDSQRNDVDIEAMLSRNKDTGLLDSVNDRLNAADSEDDEQKNGITVEERRARLKRTLSPSFYSEDIYRLKKPRVRDDSFMCKL